MDKNNNNVVTDKQVAITKKFSGQALIVQVLNLIPKSIIEDAVTKFGSDRYCKKLHTREHLAFMLFGVITGCRSLRDKVHSIIMLGNRLIHFNLSYTPARSTLSDANKRRKPEVFAEIYASLVDVYRGVLSDRSCKVFNKIDSELAERKQKELQGYNIKLVDGTTISLFKEIMKNSGRAQQNGKRKGGIKCTVELPDSLLVPTFVNFSSGATNDKKMLSKLNLKEGDLVILDKGYNKYTQWRSWSEQKISFVTRLNEGAKFELAEKLTFDAEANPGVLSDEYVMLGKKADNEEGIKTRLVVFQDPNEDRQFFFASNLGPEISPYTIAMCYKKRWDIELLFKQLKQNFELNHFYGDNENALLIQIWSALIANLLITVMKVKSHTKISFSCLVALIRKHTGSYIDLMVFLAEPYQTWRRVLRANLEKVQLEIFATEGGTS